MSTPNTPFYPMTHDDAMALIAALAALNPGLVTTAQSGLLGPDAEAIEDGFIKLATSENKGLMSRAFAALLESPDKVTFYANSATGTAGFHNSIYRGKNLGTSVTSAQYAAISAGTFDNLFIGDYWVINDVNWRIAAFDYWLRCGDTECTTHHVVIVPDTTLDNQTMNDSNVTTGAYVGSKMYTDYIETARGKCRNAFGSSHILSHKSFLKNAVTNGYESAGAWYDSEIELMTEQNVYGGIVFSNNAAGTSAAARFTIDKSQFPLFALEPSRICCRSAWALRDVASAVSFAYVAVNGSADALRAATTIGVRPAFGIKA